MPSWPLPHLTRCDLPTQIGSVRMQPLGCHSLLPGWLCELSQTLGMGLPSCSCSCSIADPGCRPDAVAAPAVC